VAIKLDTPRTAGIDPGQVVFAATAADVGSVVVAGRSVVRGGRHILGDVGAMLTDAIASLETSD
jgi:cytosine/adenosine deaminase-related metal-dependent hydrolase